MASLGKNSLRISLSSRKCAPGAPHTKQRNRSSNCSCSPHPRFLNSLIILTIVQSHLASWTYWRITFILGSSSDPWQPVLLSSSLFHIPKDNTLFAVLVSPEQKMARTFSPSKSELGLLVIYCMGAVIQESTLGLPTQSTSLNTLGVFR